MTNQIIVVGSINIDHVVRTTRLPQPGETILGNDYRIFFGGKGANQSIAAARCGASVSMIGKVGDDDSGRSARDNLERNGVAATGVRNESETPTGMAMILVEDSGQNMIAVVSGANSRLKPDNIETASPMFQNAGLLIVQLEIPLETVEAAILAARKAEAHVVLNPSPGRPLPENLLTQTDSFILNETELVLITGENDLLKGVTQLVEKSGARVVVTLGAQGVVICAPDYPMQYIASHKVEVVDTVGAGDAFVGAYAAAVTEGKSFAQAAAWGNAAGALAVTKPGAQSALPIRGEVLHLAGETVIGNSGVNKAKNNPLTDF